MVIYVQNTPEKKLGKHKILRHVTTLNKIICDFHGAKTKLLVRTLYFLSFMFTSQFFFPSLKLIICYISCKFKLS